MTFGDMKLERYDDESRTRALVMRFAIVFACVAVASSVASVLQAHRDREYVRNELKSVKVNNDENEGLRKSLVTRLSRSESTLAHMQEELHTLDARLHVSQTAVQSKAATVTARLAADQKQLESVLRSLDNGLSYKADATDARQLRAGIADLQATILQTEHLFNEQQSEIEITLSRNREALEQLRKRASRDYFEFVVTGGARQKVSDTEIQLISANPKLQEFSLVVFVDGKEIKKRDWSVDEPIYFYSRGAKSPLELVVKSVDQDKASGYLSVPKSVPDK